MRRPGQLLIELAEELRWHNAEVEDFFETLQHQVMSFHERLSDAPPPPHPLDYIRNPEYQFHNVLSYFTDFLPKGRTRVILIIDTAEELAKAPPVESILPSVAATFEILEKVHSGVPSVRVIFAGRRPLALGGNGWEIDKNKIGGSEAPGDYKYLPDAKEYLRLHVIRGFTEKRLKSSSPKREDWI